MSLQSYLENLRTKPEHIRRRYAYGFSFCFTSVVFFFWLGSFSTVGLSSGDVVASAVNKTATPAQSLVAGVGSFFFDIKDLIFGSKKVTYSSVEVRPGD